MKKGITLILMFIGAISCLSQRINKDEVMLALEKNIHRIQFSKLSFFSKELIQLGVDTSFQSKFKTKLNEHDGIKRRTKEDQMEYHLTLNLLYSKLEEEKDYSREFEIGKKFFLDILSERGKKSFRVDEKLIIQQLDVNRRSLVNGYDEGTVGESSFIFFCYNPVLYKKALLKNGLTDDWKRTATFLCNYLRENENPIAIRAPIKNKILNILTAKHIRHEFKDVVNDLSECDVSLNLLD